MKSLRILLAVTVLIIVTVSIEACKKDDGGDDTPQLTEKQRVTALLIAGQWKIKSLTIDGVASAAYPNLAITFTAASYTSTGGDPVWPSTGGWSFTDDTAKAISRSDQTAVSIESIDANNLTLSLNWTQTTLAPGRVMALAGKHVFVMTK